MIGVLEPLHNLHQAQMTSRSSRHEPRPPVDELVAAGEHRASVNDLRNASGRQPGCFPTSTHESSTTAALCYLYMLAFSDIYDPVPPCIYDVREIL
jgi:hypothetical protein